MSNQILSRQQRAQRKTFKYLEHILDEVLLSLGILGLSWIVLNPRYYQSTTNKVLAS